MSCPSRPPGLRGGKIVAENEEKRRATGRTGENHRYCKSRNKRKGDNRNENEEPWVLARPHISTSNSNEIKTTRGKVKCKPVDLLEKCNGESSIKG